MDEGYLVFNDIDERMGKQNGATLGACFGLLKADLTMNVFNDFQL